jgi:hypothetical protein
MTDLRGEEKVVAATIAATVGLRVEQHDDGSRPGMHDLNIMTADGACLAAVEVVAAADPDSIQLWKLVNGRDERWTAPNPAGRLDAAAGAHCLRQAPAHGAACLA